MALADVLADAPIALYRMEELGGTVALDGSGNGRDGTYVGGPTPLGCGTLFDGSNDDALLGAAALALPLAGGTFEGWIWMDPDPTVQLFIGRDHSGTFGGDNGWMLFTTRSGGTTLNELSYRVAGREYFTGLSIDLIRAQRWVHAAVTYDAAEARLYLDGILVHVGGPHAAVPVKLPWHVSKNGDLEEHTPMRAARWAFFASKLSAERIAAHASGGSPCPVGGWSIGQVRI